MQIAAMIGPLRIVALRPLDAGGRAIHADTVETHAVEQVRMETAAAGDLEDALATP